MLSLKVCLVENRTQRDVNYVLKKTMNFIRECIFKNKSNERLFTRVGEIKVECRVKFVDVKFPSVAASYNTNLRRVIVDLHMARNTSQLPEAKNELMSALYHELEHAAQEGNLGPQYTKQRTKPFSRPVETPTDFDTPKSSGYVPAGGWVKYYFSPWEIEAYVVEMAKLAKLQRKPLADVFNERANEFVNNGHISRRQADMLIKDWQAYAETRGFGKKRQSTSR